MMEQHTTSSGLDVQSNLMLVCVEMPQMVMHNARLLGDLCSGVVY